MKPKTSRLLFFAIVAVLVLGVLVWMDRSNPEDGRGIMFFYSKDGANSSSEMSSSDDPTESGGQSDDIYNSDGATPAFLLEKYMEWAEYPPQSRPLSIVNHDLVFPFSVESSPSMMADTPESKDVNGYVCLFHPKTWASIAGEEIFFTLECRDKDRNKIKVNVDSATVVREWEGQKYGAPSPDYNDAGRDGDEKAGDFVTTYRWRPLKQDWGQMTLTTNITYGPESKKSVVTTTFFSSPGKPMEFKGVFREVLSEGSLIIKATVMTYKKGKYRLEANLKDKENGEWIGYSVWEGQLNGGQEEVDFLFFGKLIRDKNLDSPFVLTSLRGHRVNLPIDPEWFNQGEEGLKKIQAAKTIEPDRELVVPWKEEYVTKTYNMEDFSKKAWSSQEKDMRIQQLKELAGEK